MTEQEKLEGRRALIMDAFKGLPAAQKRTFSQAAMNIVNAVPDILTARIEPNGTCQFSFKGRGSVFMTKKDLMPDAPEDGEIAAESIEVGPCDGCGLPMVDDKGAGAIDAKPPEGYAFLGMAYGARGVAKVRLCEDCFANALRWAAKGALGKVEVGD